jgi:hypothetical protein
MRQPAEGPSDIKVDPSAFNLADNLSAAWHAPNVTMRARQQLLRTLITDIVVDVDDDARDVVLTIHWRGGQHSELRVRKPLIDQVVRAEPQPHGYIPDFRFDDDGFNVGRGLGRLRRRPAAPRADRPSA